MLNSNSVIYFLINFFLLLNNLARDEKEKLIENLELALTWNKIDIASNDIFNGREEFTSKQLNRIMEMALVYDRPGFVELLLENKINLDDFLTPKRLFYLYNCINVSLIKL